jgi:hypothetical protein
MVPATMKTIVPVAIVVTVPVTTVGVVDRRIVERLHYCNTGKANSDTDVRMGLGGYAPSDARDPQSST